MSKRYTFKINWSSLYTAVYKQYLLAWSTTDWREKTCSGRLTHKISGSNAQKFKSPRNILLQSWLVGCSLGRWGTSSYRATIIFSCHVCPHHYYSKADLSTFVYRFMVCIQVVCTHLQRQVPSSRTLHVYGVSQTAVIFVILNTSIII